ncbi:MAG: DUF4294 domain-containing protein [Bacteroidales bacterium]|nr:DUF4294 domain-containing protein [Bacteroidales bacterium]MDD4603098.1 DUF4294 domain-containing protein [Bacteroidales bacterium]
MSPAQDTTKIIVPAKIIDGDTIALIDIYPAIVFPTVAFSTKRATVRYDRLVYNVKKVYPYAKLAGKKLREFKSVLDTLKSEKEQKRFIKSAEKQLEAQFGNEIKDLSFNQGKILIKLIYRETGNSTFDIVKELRGSFNAFIWQTLARIFGYDLKTNYDPAGTDQAIEQIVLMIDAGAI